MTPVLRSVAAMQAQSREWHAAGQSIGLVPTMGALHRGHTALVQAAKRGADKVVVSIFVNPKQFNNPDDLRKYPRTEGADVGMLATVGVDAIYIPTPLEVYPNGFATTVSVTGVAAPLEGERRPGHFDGVATVVTKLFGMTLADCAWFGQKDWQQLAVIRRLVADLNLPTEIIGVETVRDADGLALSSRNARLTPQGRSIAPTFHAAMLSAAEAIRSGMPAAEAIALAGEAILSAGFDQVEYLDLRDADMLEPITTPDRPARLLGAAWIDGVRLIDNIPV
ncbi:MAG: pantoate--beta-alanine ligase [Paracoccaceae bacterium]